MAEQTVETTLSLEERKAKVSTLLRQVDAEVKKGNHELALDLIRRVYQYDIKNLYARAFEERILVMMFESERKEIQKEEHAKMKEQVEVEVKRRLKEITYEREIEEKKRKVLEKQNEHLEKRALEASVKEMTTTRQKEFAAISTEGSKKIEEVERNLMQQMNSVLEAKQRQMEEELQRRIQELKAVATPSAQTTIPPLSSLQQVQISTNPAFIRSKEQQEKELQERLITERKRIQEEMTLRMQEEHKRVQEELTEHLKNEHKNELRREVEKVRQQALIAYRYALISLMQYKIPTDIRQVITETMRSPLSITDEEHRELERSAQVDAYIQAIRAMLSKGVPTQEDTTVLGSLQQLYSISQEEHKSLTKRVKKELGLPDETAVILAIDDDPPVLEFIAHILKQTYLNVHTAESVPVAEQQLETITPNLILCDVALPGVGGFTFYENIQKGMYSEKLKEVPFVFASVLGDQYLINAAKQLGAKAYLVKPFTRETLESTVKQALA
ncbi:MAG: response regulator [Ignavibacteriae bacterium]|nr:response regulator [Ignavibacteriota bacterium]